MTLELRIEGLSKKYPNGVQALKAVSLTIPTGMFGLLGPTGARKSKPLRTLGPAQADAPRRAATGAGKSTRMRTRATLQEADAGSVALGNIDVLRQKDQVRRVLGYL